MKFKPYRWTGCMTVCHNSHGYLHEHDSLLMCNPYMGCPKNIQKLLAPCDTYVHRDARTIDALSLTWILIGKTP
jgi:hypothetical protein